ncbi:MAG: SDR family NAD(P)-dependent oxidoreductase, partial [Duncaniella sp.]|nr:SDR family NAD(P)-dependent oxidoreductase [Duncaniella sp.]
MKYIVIMGATSGIGRGVAEIYARAGWRVGAAGRNRKALDELKKAYPDSVETAEIDITFSDAPGRLLRLIRDLGGMDIYFHASGIYFDNPDLNLGHEIAIARTNVTGFT